MLNQVVIVGRIYQMNDTEKSLTISCPRTAKNENDEYETDYIKCFMKSDNIFNSLKENCQENDLVGIKGRATSDGITIDKVTFLASTRANKEEE